MDENSIYKIMETMSADPRDLAYLIENDQEIRNIRVCEAPKPWLVAIASKL